MENNALGAISCICVIAGKLPVLFVSHAGGDWQFYCSDKNHDFESNSAMRRELKLICISHLVEMDNTLESILNLPVDMGAERNFVGGEWTVFENADEEQA